MRHLKTKIVSLLLVAMLTLSVLVIPVSAATITTISAGESWSKSWNGSENYFRLNVTEKGFYTLKITDYNATGYFYFAIYDTTAEKAIGYIGRDEILSSYESGLFFFAANHIYEVTAIYCDEYYYSEEYINANIKVDFTKKNVTVAEIPNCALTLSNLIVTFGTQNAEYVQYTPTKTGEYTLHTNGSVDGFVGIYDYATTDLYDDMPILGTSTVICLEAGKKYYIRCTSETDTNTKLSITYNTKQLKSISVKSSRQKLWYDDSLSDELLYDFLVTYKDNSTETLSGYNLSSLGYYFSVWADTYYLRFPDYNYYSTAGKQPICVSYYACGEYCSNTTYLKINSVSDWLVGMTSEIVERGDNIVIYNNNSNDLHHTRYFRLKVDKTGYYSLRSNSSQSLSTNCSDYEFSLYDKNNYEIKFDNEHRAFLMVAGQEYALCVDVTFNTQYSNSVYMTLSKESYTGFPDVNPSDWCYDAVIFAGGRNMISGYANGLFGTSDGIQRQDFLVILSRLEGASDLSYYSNLTGIFNDVDDNSYYANAVKWGYANGIVAGYMNGNFGVGDLITREQLVTFLYRYAKYKKMDVSFTTTQKNTVKYSYSDYNSVSAFAQDAVVWAISNKVINGKTSTTIYPQGNAQRCEVAQIMYNMFRNDVIA